ncbi:uncharacterized membrane protein YcaP [Ureibacillus xyleni]|uniref:Uncharacterized membrane protein YcaP n=1 Tax=Ureibacillus xyleni TaxID=614648 RepID=A0A285TVM9_9BACL|nr:DUF421 domain-containing protein [Ureibacillus xyleni]SOC27637.1 uncharacterized membrane protein YcaP [Ureibacillus xyleni]
MDFEWLWKPILIVVGGTLLLRVAGRKSISQMTLAQTVIMIGIGSLLVQPIAGEGIWTTLAVGGILVITLVLMEYVQIKSNNVEKLITGKSKILIENGQLNEKNLKKLRLTVDQLEMNLRQKSVSNISDVEWATLEPNGQVGFMLKTAAQPVTKREFQLLQQQLNDVLFLLNSQLANQMQQNAQPPKQAPNLFTEVDTNSSNKENTKHLQ